MTEVLKDRYGAKMGEIRQSGSELVVYAATDENWVVIVMAKPTITTALCTATAIGWQRC